MKLTEYLPEFVNELEAQLTEDDKRWGDTWKERPKEGQEDRIFARFKDYYDQWKNAGTKIPWLKIAGEAMIGWVRENKPDYKDTIGATVSFVYKGLKSEKVDKE